MRSAVALIAFLVPLASFAADTALSPEASLATDQCSLACGVQTFDHNVFTTGEWVSVNNDGAFGTEFDLGIVAADQTFQRSGGPSHLGNGGYARYSGLISTDGCASYKIAGDNDGASATGSWKFGFIARDAGTTTQSYPGIPSGNHSFPDAGLVIYCNDGLPCTQAKVQTLNGRQNQTAPCNMGGLTVGHYLGACVRGNGLNLVVNLFKLGATYPGDPANTDGGDGDGAGPNAGWGTATCSLTSWAINTGTELPGDPNAIQWGVWMNKDESLQTYNAAFQFDDFRTYSCQ